MNAWSLGVAFVGGLGLFMLGMRMMTDGLKVAAGRMLRDVLSKWTRGKGRAFVAGLLLTAAVQSSSAVTVATIGFVNAGILDLSRALWVVFGSNVGTTTTAWIVGATGVSVNLEKLALPIIGLGMLLRLTGPSARRGAFGEALTGFGLFFLGLEVLKEAFGTLGRHVDLTALGAHAGPLAGLMFFGIGVALTTVVQSSSAALAIVLTAASGGVISLPAAGAMVVGANVGTTSTALLATIGATPPARRTAMGHVLFNLIAAIAALALLPWMLDAVHEAAETVLGSASVGTTLALFHSAFNVLGVLLMWPLSDGLVRELSRRFGRDEEARGAPRYLDRNVMAVPAVALQALTREMARAGRHAGEIVQLALRPDRPESAPLEARVDAFDRLMTAIAQAITDVDRSVLSEPTAQGLGTLIRVSRHYRTAVEQASIVTALREEALQEGVDVARLDTELASAMRALIERADVDREGFDLKSTEQALGVLEERYERDRTALREAAARGDVPATAAMTGYHLLGEARRAVRQLVLAAEDLEALRRQIAG